MSALWNVQLLSLEDKKCTLKIKNVHSNDGNILKILPAGNIILKNIYWTVMHLPKAHS